MIATARWRGSKAARRAVVVAIAATAAVLTSLTTSGVATAAPTPETFTASRSWTQAETVTAQEWATVGSFVGYGTATATASATATRSHTAAAAWEANYWAIWNAWLAATDEARVKAEAQARPIAKALALADAQAKYDAAAALGYDSTQTWTQEETVTVNETAVVGDFVGHGTATATKSATATRTVHAATNWEAYYWSVMAAYEAASSEARALADAEARSIAKAAAQADAQAQFDAAQVPVDPEPGEGGTTPTGPNCGSTILKSDGTPWGCTFVDEFRGDQLDTTKWHPIDTFESSFSYGDCFLGERNIVVGGGTLQLSTIREDEPVTCDHPAGPVTTEYTSAAVSTFGKFSQTFGRYEIRAAMPQSNGPGLQSALWMLPQNPQYGTWPGSGEIDIVEFYSNYPDRLIPALHYNSVLPWGTRTNNDCLVYEPTAFHTYVLEWTPQTLKISIDGTTCLEHTISPLAPLVGSAPFDTPFHVNLTQMLGTGDNAFPEGQGIDQATLQVDYVRVWQ